MTESARKCGMRMKVVRVTPYNAIMALDLVFNSYDESHRRDMEWNGCVDFPTDPNGNRVKDKDFIDFE